jgi:hypothetical protein
MIWKCRRSRQGIPAHVYHAATVDENCTFFYPEIYAFYFFPVIVKNLLECCPQN